MAELVNAAENANEGAALGAEVVVNEVVVEEEL